MTVNTWYKTFDHQHKLHSLNFVSCNPIYTYLLPLKIYGPIFILTTLKWTSTKITYKDSVLTVSYNSSNLYKWQHAGSHSYMTGPLSTTHSCKIYILTCNVVDDHKSAIRVNLCVHSSTFTLWKEWLLWDAKSPFYIYLDQENKIFLRV